MTASLPSIILGIDPGSRCTGFGLLSLQGTNLRYLHSGVIQCKQATMTERLQFIQSSLHHLIAQHQPQHVAIESIFTCRNPQSALKLGQARGVALAAVGKFNLPVAEYAPRLIKQAVVGKGSADKAQMRQVMKMLLKLETLPGPDEADALAIAWCHANNYQWQQRIKSA